MSSSVPFENLDRLLNVEMRRNGLPHGVMARVYDVVRGDGNPLTERAVDALLDTPGTVGFLTGVYFPPHFAVGEIDGPIGAVVLGSTLAKLGRKVEILVEPELVDLLRRLAARVDSPLTVLPADETTSADELAARWDALVSIERIGLSDDGQRHTIMGTPFSGGFEGTDAIVNSMNAAGKLTIGLGDGGNEIGFGAAIDGARHFSPHPEGWTVTATSHVLPVCVSNLGAYALATGLAIRSGRLELLPDPEVIEQLIRLANSLGCLDGGTVDPAFIGDDGIPIAGIRSYVTLMRTIAEQHFTEFDRHF